jgi:Dolichyl-phosphate-mannose-protein mannosyltransferase
LFASRRFGQLPREMPPSVSSAPGSRYFRRPWAWWLTLLVLALIATVRICAMNFPLERDEGEYAYAGQLMLQGIPPYELAYNMKFPGTYAAYALIMALFGQTPAGIHFGVMCLTTLTGLMLYWLGSKILDPVAGMVAATCYAVLAVESGMFGFSGHATHFAAFFATAGVCAMWRARDTSGWMWTGLSGAMFGTALLMKQHAVFLCAWAAMVFAWDCWRNVNVPFRQRFRNLASAGIGMVLPFGVCCLLLWHAGVFGKFWFWTIDYARQYVEIRPLSAAWVPLRFSLGEILTEDYLLWAVVAAGAVLIWLDRRQDKVRLWLFGLAAASALTTVPGFYFRTHYFLLALPAAALLAGGAVTALRHWWNDRTAAVKFQNWPVEIFYVLLLVCTFWQNRGVWSLFSRAHGEHALLAHLFYGDEPFPEAETVSRFIRVNSSPAARIAVLGSEPEIYFLSRRHSATGYIYTYPLMETQPFARRMQAEMIRNITTNAPEFVVFTRVDSSWLPSPESDRSIFKWWDAYRTNYILVGIADIIWPRETKYAWGEGAARYGPLKGGGFEIYQRATPASDTTRQPGAKWPASETETVAWLQF